MIEVKFNHLFNSSTKIYESKLLHKKLKDRGTDDWRPHCLKIKKRWRWGIKQDFAERNRTEENYWKWTFSKKSLIFCNRENTFTESVFKDFV